MVDTLAHVLEVYFDGSEDTPLQDRIAEGIIQTVLENESVLDDLENTKKRANIAWASTLALNGINSAGREGRPLYAHKIEHELGGRYDMLHAAGLSPILPAVLEILCRQKPARFRQMGERVFGTPENLDEVTAGIAGIAKLRDRFAAWGMPMRLRETGVRAEDIGDIAKNASKAIGDPLFDEKTLAELLWNNY
jgi:alcohol dehydrogenase YqhD (iron-dependent ADH family)